MNETNWAGNHVYTAGRIHFPETVDELRRIVERSRKVKALGTRHTFNDISDTTDDLISLSRLDRVFELDRERRILTVDGGSRYGDICGRLNAEGFALANLASLPHISIAGACATGTHGSGVKNQCLSASVSAMEIVTADGDLVQVSRGKADFDGTVVHLGALGIVTKLSLDLVPTFQLRQDVFEGLRLGAVAERFDEIMSSAHSVSLFTDLQSDTFSQVWVKRSAGAPPASEGTGSAKPDTGETPALQSLGATAATRTLHPIASMPAECCTEQLGVCGDWHERLPHFRLDHMPSAGEEIQSEYLLPRDHALEAFRVLRGFAHELAPVLLISEVRTVAADTLWMSPCFGRESVAFHFTWARDQAAVETLLPRLEAALAPFGARPHWGKLFAMGATEIERLYPRMQEFRDLLDRFDPQGKLRNAFVERNFALSL